MIKNKKEVLAGYRDLLSVDDLCRIFGVSRQTIYKEIRMGKFGEAMQIGRAYRFPKTLIVQKFFQAKEA